MPRKNLIPPENFAEIASRHGSIDATASALGVSVPTARKWFDEFGVPVKKRGGQEIPMPAEVPALKAAGWTVRAIAERFGVSKSMIYLWYCRNGIDRRSYRPSWSGPHPKIIYNIDPNRYRAQYAAIIADRTAGKTLEEVGRLHGITRERVRQIMAGAQIDYRLPKGLSEDNAAKLRELVMRDPPLSWMEMKKGLGMTYKTIKSHLKEMGLKKPPVYAPPPRKCDYDKLRADYATGAFSFEQLCQKHGVSKPTAYRIVSELPPSKDGGF